MSAAALQIVPWRRRSIRRRMREMYKTQRFTRRHVCTGAFICAASLGFAASTATYTAAGTTTLTVPAGAVQLKAAIFGASGCGGQGLTNTACVTHGGGGGGSGGAGEQTYTVAANNGETLVLIIGINGANGQNAGTSILQSGSMAITSLVVNPGSNGAAAGTATNGAGGAGGGAGSGGSINSAGTAGGNGSVGAGGTGGAGTVLSGTGTSAAGGAGSIFNTNPLGGNGTAILIWT